MDVPGAWLKYIVESLERAVLVIDRDRVIRFANARAADFANRKNAEELIGRRYDAILAESIILNENGAPASPEEFPSVRVFTEGAPVSNVLFEQIHDHSHIWMSVSAIPLKDASGAVTHAVVRFEDVSQRKKYEDRLRFLIESNRVLSLTTDFETRLAQKAQLMVPMLADWCTVNTVRDDALTRIAIVHRDASKVPLVAALAERSVEVGTGVMEMLKDGRASLYEYVRPEQYRDPVMRTLVGELKACSSMIVPIHSRERVVGVLSLAYAESGRHYTQEDLVFVQEFCFHLGVLIDNAQLYEDIQRRDTAKDAFLAALSHELRNPLAPIKSALELLQLQGVPKDMQPTIAVIEHQFDHLTKLLNDLLDVSRYSRGTIHIERVPTDLREVALRSSAVIRPFLERKQIGLELQLPEEPLELMADPTRIEQALLNILNNAEKFTPAGGKVILVLEKNGDSAHLTIKDTGAGMTREELASLFDLHPNGYKGAGLGLGLILVKEIANLHGGTIAAHSEGPGQGSTFIITLPKTVPES